jgi:hypothetical protein
MSRNGNTNTKRQRENLCVFLTEAKKKIGQVRAILISSSYGMDSDGALSSAKLDDPEKKPNSETKKRTGRKNCPALAEEGGLQAISHKNM